MANISINLLPIEFTQGEVKRAKFFKVQTIGVIIILFMTFLASLTVALRILQSQNIKQVQAQVSVVEGKVGALKETQASLLLLKNRLSTINQYLGGSSKQSEIYSLITSILPPSVSVTSISIDPDGGVSLVVLADDIIQLESLLSGLSNQEEHQEEQVPSGDKIRQISVESLNRSRDGIYRVNLNIKPK